MNQRFVSIYKLTSVLISLAAATVSLAAAESAKPNIIFILADDLGFSDIGAYGQKFAETPHLDRFAQQGVRFTNGYAPAPICSASRASILTGRSPARLHFEFVSKPYADQPPTDKPLRVPAFTADLPLSEITIAEALKPAGYITAFFGKWHLTQANDRYLGHGETFGPKQQGFDFSTEERGSHPYAYMTEGKKKLPPFGSFAPGEFAPDAQIDGAIDFLRQHRAQPFFLYLSLYYVHVPVHTRLECLHEKYRAKAEKLGLKLSDAQLRYAASIETMDYLLGRLFASLDEQGLTDKTLVVFTSDNGSHPDYVVDNPLRGAKWTLYEGGVREPMLARWPGHIKAGDTNDTPIIATDFFPTFCELAQAPLPKNVALDGVSLASLFTQQSRTLPRDTLTWHFPYYHPPVVKTKPISSIRQVNLKLIYFYEERRSELYDLQADPAEQHDLASERPAEAARLRKALEKSLQQQHARIPERAAP
ncbi:sulfatase [Oleiharenicola lentus]|uniref:sulfatase n=1 Tax=Oleiharenicola lentus TaxID=2508720 RepID=UPI003F663E42